MKIHKKYFVHTFFATFTFLFLLLALETVLKPIYYKLGFSHLLVFQPPPTPPCKGGEFWKA